MSDLWMVTADHEANAQIDRALTELANRLGNALIDVRPEELVVSLVTMSHRLDSAHQAASHDMDDDLLETDVDDMTTEQRHRLILQGAVGAALKLASIAAEAMAADIAEGLGITIETIRG